MKRNFFAAATVAALGAVSLATPAFARTIQADRLSSTFRPQNLGALSGDNVVKGEVTHRNSSQVFQIRLRDRSNLSLKLTNLTGDADLELLTPRRGCSLRGGAFKSISTNERKASERISKSNLKPGCYFIRVVRSGGERFIGYDLNIKTEFSNFVR